MRAQAPAVGIDGCRGAWVVARRVATSVDVRVVARIEDALHDGDVVGIDMPIGLPPTSLRAADIEARRFVSPRGSSVFPTPPRALLDCASYEVANARSRELFGKGLTHQAWQLMPKIREVDDLARRWGDRLVEVHPECSFRALTGRPLASKHTATGRDERTSALRPFVGDAVDQRPIGARPDDVLDALAVLWSAERYAAGEHLQFGDGALDSVGLPMRIVC
jgi:predicted RNase H-like nuclease